VKNICWMLLVSVVPSACSENGSVADASIGDVSTRDAILQVDGQLGMGRMVINEVRAIGDDWVELMNAGSAPVDLSGMGLTDTDTNVDGGAPRVSGAVRFPSGTIVMPGQYVVVLAGLSDAGSGTEMNCLMGAVMRCFTTTWGISATRGETVYLLDASNRIVEEVLHPPDTMIMAGQTWARIPNGTGRFAIGVPTPGAENRPP
jgi:hypothetical protein